jgi:short chain dehydrogenase
MNEKASGQRVAVVAGATRGAGRGIAVELARAGLYVYATGRSSRASGRSEIGRPETIEETGDLIAAAGGKGTPLVIDHENPAAVAALIETVDRDKGRLDVLVNDIFGGDKYMQWEEPLWEHDWAGGLRMLQMGVHTHLITLRDAELKDRGLPVTAVGVTPGWLRSESMLDNFGVTEQTWRDALEKVPGFGISESPAYVGRGIAALSGDAEAARWAGTIVSARQLADAYGVTDTDGSKPDCWGYLAAYGWDRADGAGIEDFR